MYSGTRLNREILKNKLMNYDYSNTPVSREIIVEVDNLKITVTSEGPQGFTHWGCKVNSLERLVTFMNREVDEKPYYDLIIVDTK